MREIVNAKIFRLRRRLPIVKPRLGRVCAESGA
jgi:hypothetical protein